MLDKRYLTLSIFAQNLSYTKTAEILYITQPAVWQQLKSLEEELGITLIEKKQGNLQLTEEGKELAAYVQFLKTETYKRLDQLKHYQEQPLLKIGTTLSLSRTLLPQFLNRFAKEYPKIKVEVKNTQQILKGIENGEIDCGFIEGNFNRQNFDSIFLKTDSFIAITKDDALLPKKGKQTIENLIQQRLLVREVGSGSLAILESWLGTKNYTLTDFSQKIEIPNPSAIIQVLLSGLGFSFLYRSLVEKELQTGILKEIPLKDLTITHPIHLVYLKNSYFAKEYQSIAEKLKEEF